MLLYSISKLHSFSSSVISVSLRSGHAVYSLSYCFSVTYC